MSIDFRRAIQELENKPPGKSAAGPGRSSSGHARRTTSTFWPHWWAYLLVAGAMYLSARWLLRVDWITIEKGLLLIPTAAWCGSFYWLPGIIQVQSDAIVRYRLFGFRVQRMPIKNAKCFYVATQAGILGGEGQVEILEKANILFGVGFRIVWSVLDSLPMVVVLSSGSESKLVFTGLHSGWERFVKEMEAAGIPQWRTVQTIAGVAPIPESE